MNRIDRKTLFTIIAAGVALVLLSVIIFISVVTGASNEPEAPPAPSVTVSPEEAVIEPGVEGDPEAGSETIYENDYSTDEGYSKLPVEFDPDVSVKDNTIYDDAYIATTTARLMCEFSHKETITDRALAPVQNFYSDLSLSGSAQALSTRSELSDFLRKYERQIGERLNAKDADELSVFNCDYGDLDTHDH